MNRYMIRNIIIWVIILVSFIIFFNFIANYKKIDMRYGAIIYRSFRQALSIYLMTIYIFLMKKTIFILFLKMAKRNGPLI